MPDARVLAPLFVDKRLLYVETGIVWLSSPLNSIVLPAIVLALAGVYAPEILTLPLLEITLVPPVQFRLV